MRAPAVSFIYKPVAVVLAALLTLTLVPFAHAEGEAQVDEEAGTSPRPLPPRRPKMSTLPSF